MSEANPRSIAIVGIGCRFPGGAHDPEEFWTMLCSGSQAIGEIPTDRIDLQRHYSATPKTPGKMITRRGGYLENIDHFDPEFFAISPREAERIDPQQRLLLETSWEALENAGIDAATLVGRRVGVYVGQWLSDFEQRLAMHPDELDFAMTLGSGRYAASGRIAYAFGLRGPTLTLDTACSSSLYAVHLAVQSLRSGETSLALAGGANVILAPHIHVAYSQSGMIAPDGRCKFGDAAADGYVRSEGAAIIVLKRLDAALRDGDRIHAVIRGSAVNNDGGSSGSMGRPSLVGQSELVRSALADAGVDARAISYVEAHGTGTRAGDSVEIAALAGALSEGRSEPLILGSVKTNIGHTEAVAGAAGLIKSALMVREGFIPPSLNFDTPNPAIPWHQLAVAVARDASPWPSQAPRLAGVNGFGISGANAHVIVEAPPPPRAATAMHAPLPVLLLSAHNEPALRARAADIATMLASTAAPALDDLLRFHQTRRSALACRAAFLAEDAAQLRQGLSVFVGGGPALADGVADPRRPAKLALVFPGQGGQWTGMARQLLAHEPVFRKVLERADTVIRAEGGPSLLEQINLDPGADGYLGDRIDVVQPMLATISIAYAEWLQAHGLHVDAVVGHSMGEAAAAHVCGAIAFEDALKIVCRRSALMRQKSGQGTMALVDLPQAEVVAACAAQRGRVSIAAINSPRTSVISGQQRAVAALVARFNASGVFSQLINVDVASHSPQMDEAARELGRTLAGLATAPTQKTFVSSVLGEIVQGEDLDAAYWTRNLREPVRFADALEALAREDIKVLVELGPHPTLVPSIEQTLSRATVAACGRRGEAEWPALLAVLARAWCAGSRIDWSGNARHPARVIDMPRYPWQRRRLWVEAAEMGHANPGAVAMRRGPDEEARSWLHGLAWRDIDAQPKTEARVHIGPWLFFGDCPTLVAALRQGGAAVDDMPLDQMEAFLDTLPAGRLQHVIIVAPSASAASFLPVRAAQSTKRGTAARLWFVTSGAQNPPGTARLNIDHAALWGAARVLSDERPDLWGGLLDLPAELDLQSVARAATFLLAPGSEDQVAVRAGRAFVPRIVSAAHMPGTALRWKADGAYLLTGGFGDVGLAIARAMVEEGARRLILIGRTALPQRRDWRALDAESLLGKRVAAVRALEAMGAAIHCVSLDVSNEVAVRRFLDEYEKEGWPPVRGVVHLAAVLDRRLISETTAGDFEEAVAAKLRSAQVLDRCLPDLDCFALFSSMSTFLPQPGMVGYVAANAGLEAIAMDRRARGAAASVVVWGHWHGAGMISGGTGEALVAELSQRGLRAFEPEQGAALFAWAAGRSEPWIAIAPIDWAAYSKARLGRDEPMLREVKATAQGGGLANRLDAAGGPERRVLLSAAIIDALARTLQLSTDRIDRGLEFGVMGLTSLLAMEFRNRLERAVGRALPATLAWNYPTVGALADHLAGDADAPAATATVTPIAPIQLRARLSAVAEMSEADAFAALRTLRRSESS
jgi:phthiocerol/phenolphthiocerol synthesis type-I polyketide synthase B